MSFAMLSRFRSIQRLWRSFVKSRQRWRVCKLFFTTFTKIVVIDISSRSFHFHHSFKTFRNMWTLDCFVEHRNFKFRRSVQSSLLTSFTSVINWIDNCSNSHSNLRARSVSCRYRQFRSRSLWKKKRINSTSITKTFFSSINEFQQSKFQKFVLIILHSRFDFVFLHFFFESISLNIKHNRDF